MRSVSFKGRSYSLDNLQELSVRAPDFTVTVDGEEAPIPPLSSFLYTGFDNGAAILVMKDENGDVSFVDIVDGGSETMLLSMKGDDYESGMMVAFDTQDFDCDTMNSKFHYEEGAEDEDIDHEDAPVTPTIHQYSMQDDEAGINPADIPRSGGARRLVAGSLEQKVSTSTLQ